MYKHLDSKPALVHVEETKFFWVTLHPLVSGREKRSTRWYRASIWLWAYICWYFLWLTAYMRVYSLRDSQSGANVSVLNAKGIAYMVGDLPKLILRRIFAYLHEANKVRSYVSTEKCYRSQYPSWGVLLETSSLWVYVILSHWYFLNPTDTTSAVWIDIGASYLED